jgi:4'-phosphopantetheinyl transferase
VLRELLGLHLHARPGRIRYEYRAFGRPELHPRFGGRLRFNLSHSGDLALVAIAAESDVGVDVEYCRSHSDYAEIARQHFSATEVDQLNALPEPLRAEAFLACWTKKEAYVKARGRGLAMPLNGFTVPLTTDPAQGPATVVAPNDTGRAVRWTIHTLRPAPGFIGALAVQGGGWRLSQWQWRMQAS